VRGVTENESLSAQIQELPATEWRALEDANFPFFDFAFLHALEVTGCVGRKAGWTPHYLTIRNLGRLVGASVVYTKSNSYGEYIFDWSWAEAYLAHGVPYFPKLTAAAPFTPATGPKFLCASDVDKAIVAPQLIDAALALMERGGHSSLHYLFVPESELSYFINAGFLIRHSYQYHWLNNTYQDFAAFIGSMKPKRRKQIQRERDHLRSAGLTIKIVTGGDLTADYAKLFHSFYLSTIVKMRAIPYLSVEFFLNIFSTMRAEVVLMLAEESGSPIAGALYFRKGQCLYGRYWGALKEVRNLHFELCYYQPIEWAIGQGLQRFEAGAQGEHKIARGLLPQLTYSAHWIRHPGFREAIGQFIKDEQTAVKHYFDEIADHSPFVGKVGLRPHIDDTGDAK